MEVRLTNDMMMNWKGYKTCGSAFFLSKTLGFVKGAEKTKEVRQPT
jgi:hypothetical protein